MSTYIQRFFFVTGGTNCEDILNALGSSNYNKSESCNITELGVKEMHMAQSNEKIKAIINNSSHLLTASSKSNIQSGMVFYSSMAGKSNIYPIPGISKEREKLANLKKSFNPEFSNRKYWNGLGLRKNASFSNVMGNIPKIDWKYMENKMTMNLTSFLLKLAEETITNTGNTKNIILISDAKTIKELLRKMISSSKFKIEKNPSFEYSSIWNIDVKITADASGFKYQVNNDAQKVYPTPSLSAPLKYNPSSLSYTFPYNGFEFILFDALKKIPLKYLKYITYILCGKKREIINSKLKNRTNQLKEENLIPEVKIKNKKADMFEHLIKNYV